MPNLYSFNVDHTLEISQGPVTLQMMMDLRVAGHIVGLCGNWELFCTMLPGWQHLISFMNVGIGKAAFLMALRQYIKADDYVMVGNDPSVYGASDDSGAAAKAGWRFILGSDFAAGAR